MLQGQQLGEEAPPGSAVSSSSRMISSCIDGASKGIGSSTATSSEVSGSTAVLGKVCEGIVQNMGLQI